MAQPCYTITGAAMISDRDFRRALVAACLLHALALMGTAVYRGRAPVRHALPVPPIPKEIEVALTSHPEQPSSPSSGSGALRLDESSARSAERVVTTAGTGQGVVGQVAEVPEVAADLGAAASESGANGAGSGGSLGHLTPHQLGLDGDHALAFALSRQEEPKNDASAANDRLRQSMQQGHVDYDRELGLGVPAPLVLALESAARDLAIPTNSTALFSANFDGSGALLGFELLQSDHASPQWNKLEQRVQQMLNGRKLSIAKNTRGVDLKLKLIARSTLPSGADPGTEVNLLGVPVKKGQGKRSSKVSILDPTPKLLEFEIGVGDDTQRVKVPVPGLVLNALSLGGDPSDIGAPVRHMIRVQIVDEKIY